MNFPQDEELFFKTKEEYLAWLRAPAPNPISKHEPTLDLKDYINHKNYDERMETLPIYRHSIDITSLLEDKSHLTYFHFNSPITLQERINEENNKYRQRLRGEATDNKLDRDTIKALFENVEIEWIEPPIMYDNFTTQEEKLQEYELGYQLDIVNVVNDGKIDENTNILDNFIQYTGFKNGTGVYQLLNNFCNTLDRSNIYNIVNCFANEVTGVYDSVYQDIILGLLPKTVNIIELLQTKIYRPIVNYRLPKLMRDDIDYDSFTGICLLYLIPLYCLSKFMGIKIDYEIFGKSKQYFTKIAQVLINSEFMQISGPSHLSRFLGRATDWIGHKKIGFTNLVKYVLKRNGRAIVLDEDNFYEVNYTFPSKFKIYYTIFSGNSIMETVVLPCKRFLFNYNNVFGLIVAPEMDKWTNIMGLDFKWLVDSVLKALQHDLMTVHNNGFVVPFKNCTYLLIGEIEMHRTKIVDSFYFCLHKIIPTLCDPRTDKLLEVSAHITYDGANVLTFSHSNFGVEDSVYDYIQEWGEHNKLSVKLGGLKKELYHKLKPLEMFYVCTNTLLLESLVLEYLTREYNYFEYEIDESAKWENSDAICTYLYEPNYNYEVVFDISQYYLREFAVGASGCLEDYYDVVFDRSMQIEDDGDDLLLKVYSSEQLPTIYEYNESLYKVTRIKYINQQLLQLLSYTPHKFGLETFDDVKNENLRKDVISKLLKLQETYNGDMAMNVDITNFLPSHWLYYGHCRQCATNIKVANIYNNYHRAWKLFNNLNVAHQNEHNDGYDDMVCLNIMNTYNYCKRLVQQFINEQQMESTNNLMVTNLFYSSQDKLTILSNYLKQRQNHSLDRIGQIWAGVDSYEMARLNVTLTCLYNNVSIKIIVNTLNDNVSCHDIGCMLLNKAFENQLYKYNTEILDLMREEYEEELWHDYQTDDTDNNNNN